MTQKRLRLLLAEGSPGEAAETLRALYAGNPGDDHVWKSIVICAVLVVVAVGWSARLFARSVR